MKKIAIATLAIFAMTTMAFAAKEDEALQPGGFGPGGLLDCSGAVSVTCGDSSTNSAGPGVGNVDNYGCSGLLYNNAEEFVYELCVGATGVVDLTMTYTHNSTTNDLDLWLLGSCDENDCLLGSTATSGTENINTNLAAGTYYVVVDGWGGRQDGSAHTLTVTCDTPCGPTPTFNTTWGQIKASN